MCHVELWGFSSSSSINIFFAQFFQFYNIRKRTDNWFSDFVFSRRYFHSNTLNIEIVYFSLLLFPSSGWIQTVWYQRFFMRWLDSICLSQDHFQQQHYRYPHHHLMIRPPHQLQMVNRMNNNNNDQIHHHRMLNGQPTIPIKIAISIWMEMVMVMAMVIVYRSVVVMHPSWNNYVSELEICMFNWLRGLSLVMIFFISLSLFLFFVVFGYL